MRIYVHGKNYDPDVNVKICNTPDGILYQKSKRSQEFYLYNPAGETNAKKITSVSWPDANNLVKTYGTKEQWMEYFTTYGKSTGASNGTRSNVSIDDYHYIKAVRNADRLKLSVKEYICRLIDKDDSNNNYAK